MSGNEVDNLMPIPETAPNSLSGLSYPVATRALGNMGPYKNFTTLWYFCTQQLADLSYEAMAYKSTDNGVTFTPVPDTLAVYSPDTTCVSYDNTGSKVYISFIAPSDGFIKFARFDMNVLGGTWGSVQVTAPTVTPTGGSAAVTQMWCANHGTSVQISWKDNAGLQSLYWNGSIWTGPNTVAAAGNTILPLARAGSGNFAMWSADSAAYGDAGAGSIYYTLISNGAVVSTHAALTMPSGDNRIISRTQYSSLYDVASDTVGLPLAMFLHSDSAQFHGIVLATTSNAPTFSLVNAVTFNATDTTGWPWLAGQASGGNFSLLWYQRRFSDSEDLIQFSLSALLASGWGSATLFYDQQAHPPTPTPTFDGMFPLSANTLNDGTTGVIVGITEGVS